MNTLRAISIWSSVGLAAAVLAGPRTVRADACAAAIDAAIAQAKVPHADMHVTTMPGQAPTRAEMIFVGDKAYTKLDGAWHSMAYPVQQQVDMLTANKARAAQTPHTCQKLSNSPINGEPASLFIMRAETNGKATDARVWISDRTGLPLKSEVHLGSGTVFIDEFRYGNIAAPPGVK